MNTEYRKRAKYLIVFWLITWMITLVYSFLLAPQIIDQLINQQAEVVTTGGILGSLGMLVNYLGIAGYLALVVGVYYLAKAKGYSGWIGIVLGLFNVFGLLIMLIMADKNNPQSKGSKSHKKLIIILISVPIILIILGIISSALLTSIDPISKIEEGRLKACSEQCANETDVDTCVQSCMIEASK